MNRRRSIPLTILQAIQRREHTRPSPLTATTCTVQRMFLICTKARVATRMKTGTTLVDSCTDLRLLHTIVPGTKCSKLSRKWRTRASSKSRRVPTGKRVLRRKSVKQTKSRNASKRGGPATGKRGERRRRNGSGTTITVSTIRATRARAMRGNHTMKTMVAFPNTSPPSDCCHD